MPTSIELLLADGRPRSQRIAVRTPSLLWQGDVIQSSYRADMVDMFFDLAFFNQLVEELVRRTGADAIRVCVKPNASGEIRDANSDAGFAWKDDDGPPFSTEFLRRGAVESLLISEQWALVGGPSPYHDSYTYVYLERSRRDVLRVAAQAAARFTGAHIVTIAQT